MQVGSRATDESGGSVSLADWWVRRARLVVPHLTIAADDALLTFGDALQRTLQAAALPSAPPAGAARHESSPAATGGAQSRMRHMVRNSVS